MTDSHELDKWLSRIEELVAQLEGMAAHPLTKLDRSQNTVEELLIQHFRPLMSVVRERLDYSAPDIYVLNSRPAFWRNRLRKMEWAKKNAGDRNRTDTVQCTEGF